MDKSDGWWSVLETHGWSFWGKRETLILSFKTVSLLAVDRACACLQDCSGAPLKHSCNKAQLSIIDAWIYLLRHVAHYTFLRDRRKHSTVQHPLLPPPEDEGEVCNFCSVFETTLPTACAEGRVHSGIGGATPPACSRDGAATTKPEVRTIRRWLRPFLTRRARQCIRQGVARALSLGAKAHPDSHSSCASARPRYRAHAALIAPGLRVQLAQLRGPHLKVGDVGDLQPDLRYTSLVPTAIRQQLHDHDLRCVHLRD